MEISFSQWKQVKLQGYHQKNIWGWSTLHHVRRACAWDWMPEQKPVHWCWQSTLHVCLARCGWQKTSNQVAKQSENAFTGCLLEKITEKDWDADWRRDPGRGDTCSCLVPAALRVRTCASETASVKYLITARSHPYWKRPGDLSAFNSCLAQNGEREFPRFNESGATSLMGMKCYLQGNFAFLRHPV